MKVLGKKEREDIFELFLTKKKLKFNEIEKELSIRSNMVSYHLEIMLKEGILVKDENYYYLSSEAEKYIPLFEHFTSEELSPLPIVLIATKFNDKLLLIKRNKRPYQDYWALLGGKIHLNETMAEAGLRILKEKSSLEGKFTNCNAILHERVFNGEVKHGFILFLITIEVDTDYCYDKGSGELKWFMKEELKDIVPSDLWLINNKLDKVIEINEATMQENGGELSDFKCQR